MSIYQNTYGMTDRRKPQFKLTVSTVETEKLGLRSSSSDGIGAGLPHRETSKVGELLEQALDFITE